MELKKIFIKDYEDFPQNYNKHPEKQIAELKKSYNQFGQVKNVVVWNGYFLAGHGFKRAVSELGIDHLMAEDVSEWSKEKAIAFLVADNETSKMAAPDYRMLARLLEDNIDIEVPGVDDDLLKQLKEINKVEIDYTNIEEKNRLKEDSVEELQEIWQVKLGDKWQLGNHLLVCGDYADERIVNWLMGMVNSIDLVWADPPYGMNLNTDFSSAVSKLFAQKRQVDKKLRGNKYKKVKGDNENFNPSYLMELFGNVKEQIWWGADYYAENILNKNTGSWLVWDKRVDVNMDKIYGSAFELAFSKTKHKREIIRVKWAGIFGMEREDSKKRLHPTQKPLLLFQWCIEKYLKKGGNIVDPFVGSGVSIIGSELKTIETGVNYNVIGIEIEPEYVAIVLERYKNAIGTTPYLIDNISG